MYEDYSKEELDAESRAYVNGMEDTLKAIEKVCVEDPKREAVISYGIYNKIKDYVSDEINEYIMRTLDSKS